MTPMRRVHGPDLGGGWGGAAALAVACVFLPSSARAQGLPESYRSDLDRRGDVVSPDLDRPETEPSRPAPAQPPAWFATQNRLLNLPSPQPGEPAGVPPSPAVAPARDTGLNPLELVRLLVTLRTSLGIPEATLDVDQDGTVTEQDAATLVQSLLPDTAVAVPAVSFEATPPAPPAALEAPEATIEPPEPPLGDANHDGAVDAADALTIMQAVRQEVPADHATMDVNGDGDVTLTDAVLLLQALVRAAAPEEGTERQVASRVADPDPALGLSTGGPGPGGEGDPDPGARGPAGAFDTQTVASVLSAFDQQTPQPPATADVNRSGLVPTETPARTVEPVSGGGGPEGPLKGDVTRDQILAADDVALLIHHVSNRLPVPIELGDVNGDGAISMADPEHLSAYLFQGGPPPVP